MCCWEECLKITTFDMAPAIHSVTSLAPPTERQDNPIHLPPREIKVCTSSTSLSITRDSTFEKSLHKLNCASAFVFGGVEGRVFWKDGEQAGTLKTLGVEANEIDWGSQGGMKGGGEWQKALSKAWWLLKG